MVALLVAQRRPELVDRLVLIGQYYNSSGKVTGGLVDQLRADGDQVMGFLQAEYDLVSPDGPEHFVERCIARLKQHRAIATRYDKLAVSYHTWLVLGALLIWLA